MASRIGKIALFIDGTNTHAAAKALGFDLDFKRLLLEFQSRGVLVRAFYYTATKNEAVGGIFKVWAASYGVRLPP